MTELSLNQQNHPNTVAQQEFDYLVGIDEHKERLIDELLLILDQTSLQKWLERHHPKGLPLACRLRGRPPLVLLSGDVGCGKTALAQSVATPVAKKLDARLLSLETPSDIRGSGLVGEISARITAAFAQARAAVGKKRPGILIIDEADDLATSRAQMQAHHEDRAGLNVLVKQIDQLANDSECRMAVILITNRADALDPAIRRRAALHLRFQRPSGDALRTLWSRILEGVQQTPEEFEMLVEAAGSATPLYSYSDLVERVANQALIHSWRRNVPVRADALLTALQAVEPSPMIAGKVELHYAE